MLQRERGPGPKQAGWSARPGGGGGGAGAHDMMGEPAEARTSIDAAVTTTLDIMPCHLITVVHQSMEDSAAVMLW